MAGFGKVNENNGPYLSVAGGFLWNRKADRDNPYYGTQDYKNQKGETETRSGAKYPNVTCNIANIFIADSKYGENLNVPIDVNGENFIVSIKKTRKEARDLMHALFQMDLDKEVLINPYEFK